MSRSCPIVLHGGKGPSFLKLPSENWPSYMEPRTNDMPLIELVKSPQQQTYVLTATVGSLLNLVDVIDCEKYSNLNHLLHITKDFR